MPINLPNAFCASEIPGRTTSECLPDVAGRIVHIAFVKKGTAIATTSVATAITAIEAAELAGNALIIRNTYAEMPTPSYREGVPAGNSVTRFVGADRTITGNDHYAITNVEFWNAIRNQAGNYNMYAFTPTAMWPVVGKTLVVRGDVVVTRETDSILGEFEIRWNSADAPVPVFGSSDALAEIPTLAGGTITNFGAGTATITGTEVEVSPAEAISIQIAITSANEYALSTDAPAGLTLNPTNGVITGTAPAAGNYTFSVTGQNTASGIQKTLEITLIVA